MGAVSAQGRERRRHLEKHAQDLVAAADDSVLLKPKFVAGRTIYIETRKKTEQTMSGGTFGDEGMSVKRDQILAVRRKIDKVTAAEVEMTLAFDRISQSFDGRRGSRGAGTWRRT